MKIQQPQPRAHTHTIIIGTPRIPPVYVKQSDLPDRDTRDLALKLCGETDELVNYLTTY